MIKSPTSQGAIYHLHPKQGEALAFMGLGPTPASPPVEELLFGGQAGGGKSHVARALGVSICTMFPGTTVPIFRRTYKELEETHIRSVVREVPRSVAEYHTTTRELRFKNDSILEFRHCEDEQDINSYLSAEWGGLIIDEATSFTKNMITLLRSRVRSVTPGWRPFIFYCTNPGGIGHAYFKAAFVDASTPGVPFIAPEDDGGLRRLFLPAKLTDNPSLDKVQYAKVLQGIADPDMRRAYRDGDWDLFITQFFSQFKRQTHVVPQFRIPKHWTTRRVGIDFGVGAPWSCHFYARDEDLWAQERIRRWYVYKEFYGPGVADYQQAQIVKQEILRELSDYKELEYRPTFIVVADPSMWNKKPDKSSIAKVFFAYGVPLTKADNDRIQGWNRMKEYLALQPDNLPGIMWMDNCIEAIRTLPNLSRDKKRPEDLDTDEEDHAADETRYVLMHESRRERVPMNNGAEESADPQEDADAPSRALAPVQTDRRERQRRFARKRHRTSYRFQQLRGPSQVA